MTARMMLSCVRFCRVLPGRTSILIPRFRLKASKEPEYAPEEKLISISDVVEEAKGMGENLIFEDHKDEPVFKFEERIRGKPEERSAEMPNIKNALDASVVDVTSAYAPEQGFKEITVDEFKEQMAKQGFALLLDVRGPIEFASGHVPGAKNIPLAELNGEYVQNSFLKDFKEKPIAVICGIGKRSAQATVRLTRVLGFEDVTSVAAGTKEWIARGYTIET